MPVIAIISIAIIAYLYFTGKLLRHHMLPLALACLALFFFARGAFPFGAAASAAAGYLGRGFLFSFLKPKGQWEKSQEVKTPDEVIQARALLGVSAADDEQAIKNKYRKLLEKHHPDRGGDEDYARAINIAKDVLIKYQINNQDEQP